MKMLRTKTKIYEWKAKDDSPYADGLEFAYTFYNYHPDPGISVTVYYGDINGKGFSETITELWKVKDFHNHFELVNVWELKKSSTEPVTINQ